MTVYKALIADNKQPHCEEPNPCCEKPCDEPSFWDLLPQRRLNWIALGLAAFAIGFGLIGLGYLNVGVIDLAVNLLVMITDSALITQGIRLTRLFLTVILVFAWFFFRACSDGWKTVVIGSLIGASGFPLAAIGLLYFSVAIIRDPTITPIDFTWFNISISLVVASIISFLLLAVLLYINRCTACISAKKGVVVSLIFLGAGWAAWSLGRLLNTAVITFRYAQIPVSTAYFFPATAYWASIAVSIVNIMLALALGWYVLTCSTDNCFTTFLPLFASAAPLGNWALYRVGFNVFSYVGFLGVVTPFPVGTPLIQFAVAIGLVSIPALILAFIIANGFGDAFVPAAASAIPLLYAIATYARVATARNLYNNLADFVTSMLRGIFSGIVLTTVIVFFLSCRAKCPIPRIIYGLGAGVFGWAIIYLYSTYSSNYLDSIRPITDSATLSLGLTVIITAAVVAVLFTHFFGCDELVDAVNFTNIALLTAGAGGFIGTIAYYQDGSFPEAALAPADIRAAATIYTLYVLIALILPRLFVKCGGAKRQLMIAIASLAFGIAAIDLGRAIAYARAVAFNPVNNIGRLDFSPLTYIASAIGAVLAGQVIVWAYSQSNVYTSLIAAAIGLLANGIALQITFFVIALNTSANYIQFNSNTALIGVPWLIFTLVIVGLLLFLEFKSLCLPQHCRFLIGLLIPVLGIAVFGKVAGASAALGTAFNDVDTLLQAVSFLPAFAYTSRLILVNSIIPLVGFIVTLRAFKCTSCLAYLPSSVAFIAVVYVTSQFELIAIYYLAPSNVYNLWLPFVNFITSVYLSLYLGQTDPTIISNNAAFITQVGLTYILFFSPALIASLVFSCSRPVTSAILGTAIAATAISFGAFGSSNAIAGVFEGCSGVFGIFMGSITDVITFAQFLEGIQSQFVLLAIGIATALFILNDKCKYRR